MPESPLEKQEVLEAIRRVAKELGRPPSRREFLGKSGITEYAVLRHFPSWREAVRGAGLDSEPTNVKLSGEVLLSDWGEVVRKLHQIPTRNQYRGEGKYSPGAFERHFGGLGSIPEKFREFAQGKSEWADVLAMLSAPGPETANRSVNSAATSNLGALLVQPRHSALKGLPTYGDPLDFRGLRHEPVNEQGVVFLFGMVARELGYMVEAIQAGFPDCEAKRQVRPGKWQRVRIEFEFESRNFRDHGHPLDGCDVIVCWVHNWAECPSSIEVVELKRVIKSLARSEE